MNSAKQSEREFDQIDPNFNGEDTFASHSNRNDFDSFLSEKPKANSSVTNTASMSNKINKQQQLPQSRILLSERINESMTPDEIDIYGFQSQM